MKKLFLPLFFSFTFFVYGVDEAPSSVELVIPPIVVEFEDQLEQVMELKIPDYEDIILPDFELSLPEPEDMTIDSIDLDLPLPGIIEDDYSERSSFFSEGVLGIGNRNHLIGNISLFRLGQGLRFSLLFAHDGIDGFGQNAAGMGYFSRKETFEGDFRNGDESFMINGSGSFLENEDGLQGKTSSYTSVIHRLSNIILGISGSGVFSWEGNAGLKMSGKTLSGETPELKEESILSFDGGVSWQKKWFGASLQGDYTNSRISGYDNKNLFNTDLELSFSLNPLDLNLKGGIFLLSDLSMLYPFSIDIDGAFQEYVQYQSSAGYLVNNYLNYEAWIIHPFAEISEGIDTGWFWDGRIIVSPLVNMELGFQWKYHRMDSYMSLDPELSISSNGLFSVESITGNYLYLSPFIKMAIPGSWDLQFGWNGQILADKDNLEPINSVSTEISYNKDIYGFYIQGNYSFEPFIKIPTLALGINYTITKGIVISFEGEDILGFFAEDRTAIGSYIDVGGKISLLTKISL